jgi:hypothetical protein
MFNFFCIKKEKKRKKRKKKKKSYVYILGYPGCLGFVVIV